MIIKGKAICKFCTTTLITVFLFGQAQAADTVRPIKGTTATSWFQHIVLQKGLEAVGYSVGEHAETKYPVLHLTLGNGDADYTANHWNPLHDAFYSKSGGDDTMTRFHSMTTGCAQGYLIDKATADKHNITNIDQIIKNPEIAKLFDSDGDGKANLTGCDPGWGCERVIEHQMDAFDMRGSVNHDQGSYFALIANTIARYEQGDPVFYYTWTPMWLGAVLVPGKDVVWLNVPFSSSPDDPNADTSAADGSNSGFAMNTLEVVANNDFLAKNPAANRFFELFRLSLGDIAAQSLLIHNGENKMDDFIRHADEWIAANQDAFDSWVAEAKKVGL